MLNEVEDALVARLQTIPGVTVVGTEHYVAMISKTDYLSLYFKDNQFPLIMMNFTEGEENLKGMLPTPSFRYNFTGDIHVITRNINLRTTLRALRDLVYKSLYKKLLEIPSPIVNGKNIIIKLHPAQQGVLNQNLQEILYLGMFIPVEIEFYD